MIFKNHKTENGLKKLSSLKATLYVVLEKHQYYILKKEFCFLDQ